MDKIIVRFTEDKVEILEGEKPLVEVFNPAGTHLLQFEYSDFYERLFKNLKEANWEWKRL